MPQLLIYRDGKLVQATAAEAAEALAALGAAAAGHTHAELMTASERAKLAGLPDAAALAGSLAGKASLVGGKLDPAQVPDIALQQYLGAVATEAAMLALVGQAGDWCSRSDTGTDWRIVGDPSTLAGWLQTSYPSAPVSSVNGKSGVVVLTPADIGSVRQEDLGPLALMTLPEAQAAVSGDGVGPRLSASGNLISPGVGQNGRIVCDWSADLGALLITAGTGTASLDSGVMIDGRPALRYIPGAAAETGVARYTLTTPCRIQDIRSIQIPVRHTAQVGTTVSGAGNATANIQIWLITSANKQFRLYLRDAGVIAGGDTVYTWSPRETTDTYVLSGGAVWMQADGSALCSAENETVTQFQVVHFSSVQSASFPVWLGPVYVNRRASHGIVSLRLDKCTASQYSIAWPIMQKYGIKATLALLSSAIDTPGYLTSAQIFEMVAGGCDVALHTHTTTKTNGYANAADWPSADLIAQDITAGVKVMCTSGWRWAQGLLIEGFTGGYTTGDIVRQRLIRSALNNAGMLVLSTMQGVSATYRQQNYIGPRITGIGQRRIQCQQTLAATTSVSAVTDGVAQAAADGTLMGILAHDFVANGATPTGNAIRAGDFETICAAIKSSGALSLPLGDVLRHMY